MQLHATDCGLQIQAELQKVSATEKNLRLVKAVQRVVEVETELKSQGLAMETQKVVLVSKVS